MAEPETPKKVAYRKVKKVIDGEEVECEVCLDKKELYHLTSVAAAGMVIEAGKMEPSGHSKSVSLSANPDHTYGGRVKITFDRRKLPELQPMCYYDMHSPTADAYYRAEDKRKKESNYARSLDDMRAEIGMQPDVYQAECEWFTRETLPVPKDSIKKIQYFITPPMNPARVDCTGYFPHIVDLHTHGTYRELLSDIKEVRQMAQKVGAPFEVMSCFPFIQLGPGQYIDLTDDNLGKLSRVENPVIINKSPLEECRDVSGCRRE